MSTKEITNWQDETALDRFQLISPLLDEQMDSSQLVQKRKEIAEACGKSEKTIRRYEQAYRDAGFGGLKPQNRTKHRSQKLPDDFDELLAEAIQLKREVPRRSVHQIIFILESEGRVGVGELKRSTLQRYLYDAGFGQKQMRKFTEGQKSSSKRFCKPHRMMLLQADIKYGPQVLDKDGKKVKTYLTSIIDDHSRYILSSVFYDNQEAIIVEETFRKAILLHGHFDAAYCDNATASSISPRSSRGAVPSWASRSTTQSPSPGSPRARLRSSIRWWTPSLPRRKPNISRLWMS